MEIKKLFTPEHIDKLEPNEIFVFGSNLQGMHGGGAARVAIEKFGAIMGQGVGLQGQSYAIPTMQGGVDAIKPYVDQFIEFAKQHTEYTFLVTRIGCGIAGFKDADIAPFFANAQCLPNVVLPKSFVKVLSPADSIELPAHLKAKVHGQTATLVDMLIELNKEKRFTSANEAVMTLFDYLKFLNHLRTDGDEVAFNCSMRSLQRCADKCFSNGRLDIEKLQQHLGHGFYTGIEAVYKDYVVEKTIKLIELLNEFRCYTNPQDIVNDFMKATGGVNHFGSNPCDYYFGFGVYPRYFFSKYVNGFWNEFAPKGTLDNVLFRDFMIERHQRGIKKYGLEAVIRRNYHNSCGDAFVTYRGGAGPVYVKVNDSRKYIKSCGEGLGANATPDYFEAHFLRRIIEEDDRYVNSFTCRLTNFNSASGMGYGLECSIPKYDYSLPIYNFHSGFPYPGGRMHFDSWKEKVKFIIEAKLDIVYCLRCPLPPYLNPKELRQELEKIKNDEAKN